MKLDDLVSDKDYEKKYQNGWLFRYSIKTYTY